MPSVAESPRARVELALRIAGLSALVYALVQSLGLGPSSGVGRATTGDLAVQLERWSSIAVPAEVHVHFAQSPTAAQRDWLAALKAAGTVVRWSAESLPPTAISVEQGADPAGAVEIAMAAPPATLLHLRDTLGLRDTISPINGIARIAMAGIEEGTAAVAQGAAAREGVRDSLRFHRLLVLGEASWETRFVAAALAERGWIVDARFAVAPGSDVYQGITVPAARPTASVPLAAPMQPTPFSRGPLGGPPMLPQPQATPPPAPVAPVAPRLVIDTSRYSAVLALDSTAGREASAIIRYLRDGGGVLLWPDAALAPGFRPVAPGGVGEAGGSGDQAPVQVRDRADLVLRPIGPLHADAVPLERQGNRVVVAARRVGAGRVLQAGYVDSWRWRMAGDSLAPEEYRGWVAGLVSRVALVGRETRLVAGSDPAPRTGLLARFGLPTPASTGSDNTRSTLPPWLLLLLVVLFLAEWTSRRTRGVP